MQNVNISYRKACEDKNKSSYWTIVLNDDDDDIGDDSFSAILSSNTWGFAVPSQLHDNIKETTKNIISCEHNRVNFNDNFVFAESDTANIEGAGCWLKFLSDTSGYFSYNPYILLIFKDQKAISNPMITIYFQELISDFKIDFYYKNVLVHTENILNNTSKIYSNTISTDFNLVDQIYITMIKTYYPQRYPKINEVRIGSRWELNSKDLSALDIICQIGDGSKNTVNQNSCNFTIKDKNNIYDPNNPKNILKLFYNNQRIRVYNYLKVGLNYKSILIGTFWINKWTYSNRELNIECYSSLFDNQFIDSDNYSSILYSVDDDGNIYSAYYLFNELLSSANIEYVLDESLKKITFGGGYFYNVSKKEAFLQLCQATSSYFFQDRSGKLNVRVFNSVNAKQIAKSFINKERTNYQKNIDFNYYYVNINRYVYGYPPNNSNPYIVFKGTVDSATEYKEIKYTKHVRLTDNNYKYYGYEKDNENNLFYTYDENGGKKYDDQYDTQEEVAIDGNRIYIAKQDDSGNIVYDQNGYIDPYGLISHAYDSQNINLYGREIKKQEYTGNDNLALASWGVSISTYEITYNTKSEHSNSRNYETIEIDNPFIGAGNEVDIAKKMLSYFLLDNTISFDCNLTPYIDLGDFCKIVYDYENSNDIILVSKMQYSLSVKQSIEGKY